MVGLDQPAAIDVSANYTWRQNEAASSLGLAAEGSLRCASSVRFWYGISCDHFRQKSAVRTAVVYAVTPDKFGQSQSCSHVLSQLPYDLWLRHHNGDTIR